MRIYLCGGIRKSSDDKKVVWTEEDKEEIRMVLPEAEFLDPQKTPEMSDPRVPFGADLNDVKEADVIMVDARQKRGIGIGAEMVVAKTLGKPVVTVCQRNSHYRRDELNYHGKIIRDWKHPFMACLSDKVAETVREAAEWVRDLPNNGIKIKDGSVIQDSIDFFLKSGETRP